jgi:phosphopantothenoylcysteine decarboxylase
MANILLGVTGSVAAIYTPELFRSLRKKNYAVKIVATPSSTYFFDTAQIEPKNPSQPERNQDIVILDADEWPGKDAGNRYQRNDPVLHIELRRWANLLLIAPLDANTLAKLANGLCDNCLTCVWRAWDRARPALLAPAMNTFMWESPATLRHLRQLAEDSTGLFCPSGLNLSDLIGWIDDRCPDLTIIPPVSKRLACDDVGMGAMASLDSIMLAVEKKLKAP